MPGRRRRVGRRRRRKLRGSVDAARSVHGHAPPRHRGALLVPCRSCARMLLLFLLVVVVVVVAAAAVLLLFPGGLHARGLWCCGVVLVKFAQGLREVGTFSGALHGCGALGGCALVRMCALRVSLCFWSWR
eukprot:1081094-Rhodomonas_salina.1